MSDEIVVVETEATITVVGDVGPQGPQGIQGIQGIQGLKGDKGDTGDVTVAGTATVTATGSSAARALAARFADMLNVKDFGAVGDGVTDDRAAIQAAIDGVSAAGGGGLFVPPEVFLIGGALQAKNGVRLHGVRGISEIRLTRGVSAQILYNPNQVADTPVDDFTLENLIFNANALGTEAFTQSCVAINGVRRFAAIGCVFENATGYGLGFQAKSDSPSSINGPQSDIWVEDCVVRNNGFNGTVNSFDGIDVKSADRMFVKNCEAYGNAQKGFNFRGSHVVADGLIAYSNGQQGIEVSSGGAYDASITFSNVFTYSNALEGITVAISGGVADQRCRVSMTNIQAHDNTRSGIRIYENSSFTMYGEFEVSINGALSWNNAEYGFINSSGSIKALSVSGLIATGNTESGIYNNGSNALFSACSSFGNDKYGYDSPSATTGNQFVGGNLSSNTLGAVHYTATVNTLGVTGIVALQISQLANAVNYLKVEGRTTGGGPRLSAEGSDPNIEVSYSTKGSGVHRFFADSFGSEQFRVNRVSAATSWPQVGASTANSPGASVGGAAADIDYSITPKGTGRVRFGTLTASADAPVTGYIEVKDSGGTVRKLAVIS